MNDLPDLQLVKRLSRFAAGASVVTTAVGISALCGWALHIPGLYTWNVAPVTMKPSTALSFVLIGVSLWLLRKGENQSFPFPQKLAAKAAATAVILVGCLSLAEHLGGLDFLFDQLLMVVFSAGQTARVHAGLMSSITAGAFLLLGLALLGIDSRIRRVRWLVQLFSFSAGAAATFAILSFALAPHVYVAHLSLSVPTAFTLAVFSLGLVCARTDWGFGGLLCSRSLGGDLARRLLPAISIPLVVGWMRWQIAATGYFSEWSIVALVSLITMSLLAALIAWAAVAVDRGDVARRKTEEALHASEGRLAGIIQSAMDSIITLDDQHRILLFNTAAETMFGCPAAETLGQPVERFIPQRFQAAHGGHIRKFGEIGVTNRAMGTSSELWAVRADGEEFQIEASISQIVVGGKKLFTVILRDITERVQTEAELRANEEMLRLLLDGISDYAVYMLDPDGRVASWNAGAVRIKGYSTEEILGQPISVFYTPEQNAQGIPGMALQEAISKGRFEGQGERIRKDGSTFWAHVVILPMYDQAGKLRGFSKVLQDITARKQAEETLTQQAQELSRQARELTGSQQAFEAQSRMLQSVLDSMAEGLVATDERGNFIIWNPAAEKIVGLGAANLSSEQWSAHYGLFLEDMLTPFPAEQNPLLRAIHGESSSAQMFVRNPEIKNGAWIEVNAGPLIDKNGAVRGGVVAFRDVTQKRAAEHEIRRLNDELEHRVAERTAQLEEANKELESFTYSVAHDLRAPLRHIAGFSGILLEEFSPALDAEAGRYLQRIQQGTQKMGQLVDELLNLARVGRQAPNLRATGLGPIVQEVVDMLQPEIHGRRVEWRIADLPIVECDPTLLKLVFQNLVSNALKYSRPRPQAVIEIGQVRENGQSAIFVRDNGVGFSMKYADKLFGVFQRLHRSEDFEGTGVGLATVQRIINKHQGRIWAEAELDKGATFYFTIGGLQPAEVKTESMAVGA